MTQHWNLRPDFTRKVLQAQTIPRITTIKWTGRVHGLFKATFRTALTT